MSLQIKQSKFVSNILHLITLQWQHISVVIPVFWLCLYIIKPQLCVFKQVIILAHRNLQLIKICVLFALQYSRFILELYVENIGDIIHKGIFKEFKVQQNIFRDYVCFRKLSVQFEISMRQFVFILRFLHVFISISLKNCQYLLELCQSCF